jgi:cell division protein ZapA (FtsZ GTPase activity inhibitor)
MNSERELVVRIAGQEIRVPLYKDDNESRRAAEMVDEHFRRAADSALKVNTQVFALQTAYMIAAELLAEAERTTQRELHLREMLAGVKEALERLRRQIDGNAELE